MKTHLEKHIGYWLRSISNHVSLAFASKLATYKISIAEWVILSLLEEKMKSPASIAEAIGITRGAVSKVLDKLFHKHLIERSESVVDRRFQEIRLTAKGRELLPRLKKIASENETYFFQYLSSQEKKDLTTILMKIVEKNGWKNIPLN